MKTDYLAEKGSELILKIKYYVAAGETFASENLTKLEEALTFIFGGESREDLKRHIDAVIFAMNEKVNRPEFVTDDWLESNPTWDMVHGLLNSKLPTLKELKF